jgi:MFS family permease
MNTRNSVESSAAVSKSTLRSSDFALALMGYFLVFLSVAVFFLFPVFLDRFHPSKTRVGLIMGIHSVAAIMVRPLFGHALDERGGRKVAVGGILLMIISMPGFHLVESAGMLAVLLRALNGIGWGIASTAILAICSDLAPPSRMAHSLGIIGVAGIISGAIGPTIAEEVSRLFGFGAVFNLSIALLAVALLCLVAIRKMPVRASGGKPERIPGFAGSPIPVLLAIAAMPIIHGAVRGTIINFIALFGTSTGFSRVGPFFLAFSAAAIITRLGFGDLSDKYGRKRVIFPAAFLIALNLFWIAGVRSYIPFVMSGFVAGLGQGLIFPALSTYIIDFLGHENKGLALGLYLSLFDVGMGLGSPLFGWVSDVTGYRQMYAIAGCLLLVSTIVFSIKAPRIAISGSGNHISSPEIIPE